MSTTCYLYAAAVLTSHAAWQEILEVLIQEKMSLTRQNISDLKAFQKGNPESDLVIDFTFYDRDDVSIPQAIHDVFAKYHLSYLWEWDGAEGDDFLSGCRLYSGKTKWAHEEYLVDGEPFLRLSEVKNQRRLEELTEFSRVRDDIKHTGLHVHPSAHSAMQHVQKFPDLQQFVQT